MESYYRVAWHASLRCECPKVFRSSDVQLVVSERRRRCDALSEIIARQHFQCIARSKDDDSAGLAGGVNTAVGRYW